MRKLLVVGVLILLISSSCISISGFDTEQSVQAISSGKTLYVGGSGPGNYTKIQDAIDNASDGDTIYVYGGTYNEWIRIHKQLFMKGMEQSNQSAPLIVGGPEHDTVIIYADGCHFENFLVKNGPSGYLQIGITLNSSFNVIKNCSSFETGRGIHLDSSSNNYICNVKLWKGWKGIHITGNSCNNTFIDSYINRHSEHEIAIGGNSHNNWFYNNTLSNCKTGNGVWLGSASGVSFINNNISSNHIYGIQSKSAMNLTLLNNTFFKNGVKIEGNITHFSSHKIVGNTVNGKPLYYYVNRNNFIVPSDGGQVILINCTDGTIKNLDIYETDIGIQLKLSSNITISENSIFSTKWEPGIKISESTHNIISNNTITKCNNGIYLSSSDNNIISDNKIKDDKSECIRLSSSSNNRILRNHVSKSEVGISISGSDNNISKNVATFCKESGIELHGSKNIVFENALHNSLFGIVIESINCLIYGNTIRTNLIGIFALSSFNKIFNNNLIANLLRNAFFENCINRWRHNFWNRPRPAPKIIIGLLLFFGGEFPYIFPIFLPMINIDIRPRVVPYMGVLNIENSTSHEGDDAATWLHTLENPWQLVLSYR